MVVKCTSANRYHHLLKTFYTGAGGWADKQLPDGTITWTSSSGRTYTTKPGGALFFPILATPTGDATIRKLTTMPTQARGLMMPRRKRTRYQEQTTASTPNGASTRHASPRNADNTRPGSPPPTNPHPSSASRCIAMAAQARLLPRR